MTALVTGAASGLGAATVAGLVADGVAVVGVDLDRDGAAEAVTAHGDDVAFVAADVRDESAVAAAVDLAVERFGGLHVAVNCAGVATPGRVLGRRGPHDLEAFRTVIDINVVGSFNVVRLAAAAMARNDPEDGQRGVIVNTSSIAAQDGQAGQAAYAASKGAIASMTLPVARDLAGLGIRCVAIAPGVFATPMVAGLPEEAIEALAADVPNPRRLGHPAEFALLVRQVIANPYLNGEVIRLDGALRMR
jgi:NAD(P)-dependent dehydrogenase (short-subunit alcohol dehydrogenase family)